MKEKPQFDFTFSSRLLFVEKKNKQVIVNIFKPIPEGKQVVWVYNNQKDEGKRTNKI